MLNNTEFLAKTLREFFGRGLRFKKKADCLIVTVKEGLEDQELNVIAHVCRRLKVDLPNMDLAPCNSLIVHGAGLNDEDENRGPITFVLPTKTLHREGVEDLNHPDHDWHEWW